MGPVGCVCVCLRVELDTESYYHKSIIIVIGPRIEPNRTEAKWEIEFKNSLIQMRARATCIQHSVHLDRSIYTYMQQPLESNSEFMVHIFCTLPCVLSVFLNFSYRKKEEIKKKTNTIATGVALSSQTIHYRGGDSFFSLSLSRFTRSLLPSSLRYSAF